MTSSRSLASGMRGRAGRPLVEILETRMLLAAGLGDLTGPLVATVGDLSRSVTSGLSSTLASLTGSSTPTAVVGSPSNSTAPAASSPVAPTAATPVATSGSVASTTPTATAGSTSGGSTAPASGSPAQAAPASSAVAPATSTVAGIASVSRQSGSSGAASESSPTILGDSPATHATPSTSQPLPSADDLEVSGGVAPAQAPDMYSVPIGGDSRPLAVTLSPDESAGASAIRLWIFDGSGQELGDFALGSGADLVVVLRPGGSTTGEVVYVAVSHDGTGSPSDQGLYLLRITRLDDPEAASAGVPEAPGLVVLAATSTPSASAASPAPAGGVFASMASPEAAGPVLGLGQGGQGYAPLPTRSAGPTEAPAAGQEVAPPVDHAAGAVDRALFDLAPPDAGVVDLLGFASTPIPTPTPAQKAAARADVAPTTPPGLDRASVDAESSGNADPGTNRTEGPLVAPIVHRGMAAGLGLGIATTAGLGIVLPDIAALIEEARRRLPRTRIRARGLAGG